MYKEEDEDHYEDDDSEGGECDDKDIDEDERVE